MTNYTDRSAETLLARRALAAQATPGPWWVKSPPCFVPFTCVVKSSAGNLAGLNGPESAAHIAANSPDVVEADIDEILRLRAEVGRLEKEADWLATHVANALREPALIAHLHYLSKGLTVPPSSETIREAARKAVEEQCPKN